MTYASYKIEDLKSDQENSEFMDALDFGFGYGVLLHIHKLNEDLRSEYSMLFKTDEQIEELEKLDKSTSFESMWGMYHILVNISENVFERDEWLRRPIRELYKYLSYLKQKSIYDGK